MTGPPYPHPNPAAGSNEPGSFAIGANDDPFATGNPFDTGVDSDPFTM